LTLADTLAALSPEIVLLCGGLLVLLLDLFWHKQSARKNWLPYVGLIVLAGALAATIATWLTIGSASLSGLLMLDIDGLAMVTRLIAILATALVLLLSIQFMRDRTPFRGEFYAFLLFAALAICLVGAASNLVLVFISVELLSITSYVLTGYLRDDPRSNEGALKYFLYGAVLSAVMLYGMSLMYGATGATDLRAVGAVAGGSAAADGMRSVALTGMVLIIAGFGFKIAAVPFHQWAPDAYEGAPTPVTAFLSVGPKAAGFAVLVRFLLLAAPQFVGDWVSLLSAVAMVTMTLGNVVAIVQKNIKRMIAYSSIAQAGYILIAVAALGAGGLGIQSVLMYLMVYLFANLGLFAVIISVYNAIGSDEIGDYAGLHRRSPLLAAGLTVFMLSLVGIPPTAGFFGKFLIFASAIRAELLALAIVGVLNGVISLYYYFAVVRQAYFVPPKDETAIAISPALRATLIACLVLVLGTLFFMQPLLELLQSAASTLT